MSYRYEKNQNGEEDLVIDGFEKGIADSPYQGIANMRNVNIKYYPGVAYANYERQAATLSYGTFTFTSSLSVGAVSGTLTSLWAFPTGSFTVVFSSGETRVAAFNNGSLTVGWAGSGALTQNATATITVTGGMTQPTYYCTSPGSINYIQDNTGQIWKESAINSSTFNILANSPTTGANGQGIAFWNNYLVVFRQNFIDFCGDGTGDSGIISSNWLAANNEFYIGNITTLAVNGGSSISAGDTSATISTYTDAGGNSRSTTWFGNTGTYQMLLSSGETIPVLLTFGSHTITFANPAQIGGSATNIHLNILIGTTHMTLVSRNDGNLYFTNGNAVGSLSLGSTIISGNLVPATIFVPGGNNSLALTYKALGLPKYETAVWLEELSANLLVAGKRNVYPWDRVSPQWTNPFPVPEDISKMINILNNVYIFAGYKGNIYLSNGYSAYPFKKIPDYIANTLGAGNLTGTAPIDVQWQWGGIMSHRLRLFFQANAFTGQTMTNIMQGVFSVGLVSGNGITLETPGSLVIENQNSYGLNSSSASAGGLLIDNSNSNIGYDNYYSAFASGSSNQGFIDFNNTTLYSNNEMVIETDLIPIGTFLQTTTHASMEFKMDEPMKSGDSITIYARQNLSGTYVLIGTTTTQVLSDIYTPWPIQEGQWIQFLITMSCNSAAASSSFNRLREIRLR